MKTRRLYRIAKKFQERKLSRIDEKYDFRGETLAYCSLLPRQGCYAPKFCGENFREQPQNREIRESYPSQAEVIRIGLHTIRVLKRVHVYI